MPVLDFIKWPAGNFVEAWHFCQHWLLHFSCSFTGLRSSLVAFLSPQDTMATLKPAVEYGQLGEIPFSKYVPLLAQVPPPHIPTETNKQSIKSTNASFPQRQLPYFSFIGTISSPCSLKQTTNKLFLLFFKYILGQKGLPSSQIGHIYDSQL